MSLTKKEIKEFTHEELIAEFEATITNICSSQTGTKRLIKESEWIAEELLSRLTNFSKIDAKEQIQEAIKKRPELAEEIEKADLEYERAQEELNETVTDRRV